MKFNKLFAFFIPILVSVVSNAQTTSNSSIISEIKLNDAYVSATGTAKVNDAAMADARDRLKNEIFDWLTSLFYETSVEKSRVQSFKEWIKGNVKMEVDVRRRPTFNDTLKAYSGVMAQGEDVKFIDRKMGNIIRVFAYIPKNKILPGVTNTPEISEAILENPSSSPQESNQTKPQVEPVEQKEQPVSEQPSSDLTVESTEVNEMVTPMDSPDKNSDTRIYEEDETVVTAELEKVPAVSESAPTTEIPVTTAVSDTPDETVNSELLKLKTVNELKKYLSLLKQSSKLADVGETFPKNPKPCYVVLFDHHNILRAKLWYDGSEVMNLQNGEKINLSSLLDKYPELVWFQTK